MVKISRSRFSPLASVAEWFCLGLDRSFAWRCVNVCVSVLCVCVCVKARKIER